MDPSSMDTICMLYANQIFCHLVELLAMKSYKAILPKEQTHVWFLIGASQDPGAPLAQGDHITGGSTVQLIRLSSIIASL